MSKMLEQRFALVTGGSGAIGQAIVRVLVREGAAVTFTYHSREDEARKLEAELKAEGARVSAVPLDILRQADCKALAERLEKEGFPVDLLVNNAGITEIMPFALIQEEDWDKLMDVNVKGPFLVTHAFIRGMIRRKRGSIVNLGSLAGQRLLEVPVHYATSKSAMIGFTLSLAKEMSKYKIRVNCVVPGLLEGGVSAHIPENLIQEFNKYCATGRAGTCLEVAELVAFLGSDRASYINAQAIHVDGGV